MLCSNVCEICHLLMHRKMKVERSPGLCLAAALKLQKELTCYAMRGVWGIVYRLRLRVSHRVPPIKIFSHYKLANWTFLLAILILFRVSCCLVFLVIIGYDLLLCETLQKYYGISYDILYIFILKHSQTYKNVRNMVQMKLQIFLIIWVGCSNQVSPIPNTSLFSTNKNTVLYNHKITIKFKTDLEGRRG